MVKHHLKEQSGKIFESKKDDKGKISFPVVIISQGLGNLSDKNYYSAQAIQQAAADKVYEGKKAYFDHPTASQEQEQPGRSVRDVAGYYKNTKAEQDENGLWILRGDLIPIDSNDEVMGLLNHASDYKKEFPDQEFIGISINGDGEGKTMDYQEFIKEFNPSAFEMQKISQVEGQQINAITKLTSAVSADLVTEPGARGRVLLESKKIKTKKRRTKMIEAMKKFLFGAEKEDKKLMEEAVKDMLQSEDGEKKEDEKKEEEAKHKARHKQAEGLAKALLAAKKELKKEEGESEEAYEAKAMKQAMKQYEDECKQAEKKEDEKKEGDPQPKKDDKAAAAKDDGDGDDDSKESKKKEGAPADDDKGHADADQDKALIKKMMKQMDEMSKEIESMKKEKKESEDEAKKHHEESAKAKIELETKKRAEGIDKVLRESGLPRYATDNLRELLVTKVRSESEMKKIVEAAKEVHTKAIESAFYSATSTGFTEIQTENKTGSNDHLF